MDYNDTHLTQKEVSYIGMELDKSEKLQIDNFFTTFLEYVNEEGRVVEFETAELPGRVMFEQDCSGVEIVMVAFGPRI